MSEIVCFEKLNGDNIIAEVLERGKIFCVIKNPMRIYPSNDGKIGLGPILYTEPKAMVAKLYVHSISKESEVAEDIVKAYMEYVKRLTSSIIQLDQSIQKVQLNG